MTFVCGLGVLGLAISLAGASLSDETIFFKLFASAAAMSAVMIATSAGFIL